MRSRRGGFREPIACRDPFPDLAGPSQHFPYGASLYPPCSVSSRRALAGSGSIFWRSR